MAVSLEQVERLREKADISYEEAKALLEQTDGDLLDALILLERQGRVERPGGGFYSTRPPDQEERPPSRPLGVGDYWRRTRTDTTKMNWHTRLREIWDTLVNVLRHSTENQFEVWRRGELMTSIPVLILIILVIVAFWISLLLLVVGLVMGCRYRFSGPDLGKETINDAMGTVSETVDEMVDSVKRGLGGRRRKRK